VITVSALAIGRRKPLCDSFSVPPPVEVATGQPVTLRSLLDHIVRAEVEAFKSRQAEQRLLKVLSSAQIEDGLAAGKVSAGGRDLNQVVVPEEAVATAIEAFSDGLFLVVLDETEVKELDTLLSLTATSKLTFIRLTLLAGG
jgi:hypothetical protein